MTGTIPVCIISGFLGAGKTTLIQELLSHWQSVHPDAKLLLIENDFGAVSFDADVLADAGVHIQSLTNGCICCSLSGDFQQALLKAAAIPDIVGILIEPSGVGKLSDIRQALADPALRSRMHLGVALTVVDVKRSSLYMENFGPFFLDQIDCADLMYLNFTQDMGDTERENIRQLQQHNASAPLWTEQDSAEMVHYLTGILGGGHSYLDIPMLSKHAKRILGIEENASASNSSSTEVDNIGDHNHAAHSCCCHHEHDHHHHDQPFVTIGLRVAGTPSLAEVLSSLSHWSSEDASLLRAKGIISTSEGAYELQYQGDDWQVKHTQMTGNYVTFIGTNESAIQHWANESPYWEVSS